MGNAHCRSRTYHYAVVEYFIERDRPRLVHRKEEILVEDVSFFHEEHRGV